MREDRHLGGGICSEQASRNHHLLPRRRTAPSRVVGARKGRAAREARGAFVGRPSERRGGWGRSSRRETCPILSTEPLKNFPLILLHSCWPNSKLEYFVNKIAKSTRYSILALLELIRFFYKRFRVSLWPCLKNCFLSRIYKDWRGNQCWESIGCLSCFQLSIPQDEALASSVQMGKDLTVEWVQQLIQSGWQEATMRSGGVEPWKRRWRNWHLVRCSHVFHWNLVWSVKQPTPFRLDSRPRNVCSTWLTGWVTDSSTTQQVQPLYQDPSLFLFFVETL
jgi:hypothetical protein